MQTGHCSYPKPAPERRIRSRSRSDYSDRRCDRRFESAFPATLYLGTGPGAREFAATVRNISSGGLLVEAPGVPDGETCVRIRFRIPQGVMPEEYVQGAVTAEAVVRQRPDASLLGLAFRENLNTRFRRTAWTYWRWTAIMGFVIAAALVLLIKYENAYHFWFDVPVFLYSLTVGGYLLSRFLFAAFYRDAKPVEDPPPISVIIPVRNEEPYIARTLRQLLESDYPRDRLQVIAVDDASTDASLAVMRATQATYPELQVLGLETNLGKRHALATGVALATGQIIVFIDSDSFLAPDALRHLVNRFADPGVGAVAGHCDVENVWTNLLTRMQAVRYFIAFRVMKAAESVFDSITCLSGPIAAYRRDLLLQVIDPWLGQTFLGRPATFGDDRSLTNALLRRGYKVQYEFRARATTIVPERHRTFLQQQMRWKRSWFRESLIASTFMWRRQPLMALSFYLGFLLPLFGPVIVLRALLYVPLVRQSPPSMYLLGILLMGTMMSSTYLLYKRSRLWIYGAWFCLYYLLVLVWQTPWAVLTTRRNVWATRC